MRIANFEKSQSQQRRNPKDEKSTFNAVRQDNRDGSIFLPPNIIQITTFSKSKLKIMLSESMLQKFTSKIEKLVSNQQSQRSDSPIYQQNSENSQERSSEIMNKINPERNKPKGFNSDQDSERNIRSSSQAKNGNFSSFEEGPLNLDDNQQAPKSQKIDVKQLSRLIAIEKQKAKAASTTQGNNAKVNKTQTQTIKKSVSPPMIQPTSAPASEPAPAPKPTVQMPKVAVMNNMVKLSIKLNCKELLKQVKYQAGVLNMAPIRLLLYVCIEKLLFHIYVANGYEKMIEKEKDTNFLEKQISAALVSLLGYLKNAQRTMISRILRAVFNRFGIPQYYSQKWLTECIKKNKKAIEKLKVDVDSIENPPTNNNITSNIFTGIPPSDVKVVYDFPNLDLEDEVQGKQKVEDPQSFHTDEVLFFFKKTFNKQRLFQTKKIVKTLPPQHQSNFNYDEVVEDAENYEQQQFLIQIPKLFVPHNTQVLANSEQRNVQQKSLKTSKVQEKNKYNEDLEIVSKKRNRSAVPENVYEQTKYDYNVVPAQSEQSKKAFILEIVEQYIFNNIEQIADKIAEKWKIDPAEVRKLIKNSNQLKMMPTKSLKTQISATSGRKVQKQKPQSDDEIIKQIQMKSQVLERMGVNHKQLVKQIFKLLELKNLSHEKKQQIMEKWIAMRKQQKKQPQR